LTVALTLAIMGIFLTIKKHYELLVIAIFLRIFFLTSLERIIMINLITKKFPKEGSE